MPTPTKGPRLGGSPSHERLMLANLATSLFEHGRITTTEAKAKRLRPLAEKLVTFAKRGDLHARRQVMTTIRDKDVVHTLFAEIGPRFADRPGGYTRITKVGPRKGDNAPMAVIELVEGRTVAQQAVGEAERARGTRFAGAASGAGAAAAAGEVTADALESADVAEDTEAGSNTSGDAVDAEVTADADLASDDEGATEAGSNTSGDAVDTEVSTDTEVTADADAASDDEGATEAGSNTSGDAVDPELTADAGTSSDDAEGTDGAR